MFPEPAARSFFIASSGEGWRYRPAVLPAASATPAFPVSDDLPILRYFPTGEKERTVDIPGTTGQNRRIRENAEGREEQRSDAGGFPVDGAGPAPGNEFIGGEKPGKEEERCRFRAGERPRKGTICCTKRRSRSARPRSSPTWTRTSPTA